MSRPRKKPAEPIKDEITVPVQEDIPQPIPEMIPEQVPEITEEEHIDPPEEPIDLPEETPVNECVQRPPITSISDPGVIDGYVDTLEARSEYCYKVKIILSTYKKNDSDMMPPIFCLTRNNGQKVYFKLNVNSEAIAAAWNVCRGKIDAEMFISWILDHYKLPAPKYYSDFKLISL